MDIFFKDNLNSSDQLYIEQLLCANELKAVLIPFLIIIAVSTVVVMIVTGKVAQFMMESAEKKKEK